MLPNSPIRKTRMVGLGWGALGGVAEAPSEWPAWTPASVARCAVFFFQEIWFWFYKIWRCFTIWIFLSMYHLGQQNWYEFWTGLSSHAGHCCRHRKMPWAGSRQKSTSWWTYHVHLCWTYHLPVGHLTIWSSTLLARGIWWHILILLICVFKKALGSEKNMSNGY